MSLTEIKDSVRKWVVWAYDHSNGIKSVAGGLLVASSYLVRLKNPALGDALYKAGKEILLIGIYDKGRKFAAGSPQTPAPIAQRAIGMAADAMAKLRGAKTPQ